MSDVGKHGTFLRDGARSETTSWVGVNYFLRDENGCRAPHKGLLQLSPPTLQIYPVRCSVYDSVKMINLQDLTGLSGQPPRPKQLLLPVNGFWPEFS